ncbi:CHASE2 domain-containing protein [Candidatus Parabeggiatoa sp. HSG14]|uniref:CHASE2 domain-containing protein n=1 Tax=Candidatus Parabeggiatoa sp. HSG14 TaxID=3055593 RepID=UPI0025A73A26|nr:CHASE2 domain-containing protein [Thiotrichales bacterium HSG14]
MNLFLGLGVAFALWYFSDSPWLIEKEDASMDWLMQISQNRISPLYEKNIPNFVFLDVDDKTYYDWGEPLFMPSRQHLVNIVNAAIEAKARLIIVDFDIGQRTPTESDQLHPDDQVLKDYLISYVTECRKKQDDSTCPLVILKRSFTTEERFIPILRTHFLDEIMTQSAPYIQWASTQLYPRGDKIIRRWKLWQPACTSNRQPVIIPSIELLAMSLVKEDCIIQDVQNTLQLLKPKNCDNDILEVSFNLCGINTEKGGIDQRIMYSMSWLVNHRPPKLPYLLTDKSGGTALTIFSAQPYAKSLSQVDLTTLKNSIVIIGGSYREGRNIYLTSLGDMPSTLIVANTLYSLWHYEKIELFLVIDVSIKALFIVIMSIFFMIFPSRWGMIISGILIIFGLLPVAMIMFFHYSMWFNFAVPLVVISIYQIIRKSFEPWLWLYLRTWYQKHCLTFSWQKRKNYNVGETVVIGA